jgi:hypothetical protein
MWYFVWVCQQDNYLIHRGRHPAMGSAIRASNLVRPVIGGVSICCHHRSDRGDKRLDHGMQALCRDRPNLGLEQRSKEEGVIP